jgi:hypothetical protein
MLKQKGTVALVLAMLICAWGAPTTHATELPPPHILLDGLSLPFEVPPTIVADRTMVPFRVIAEALGVTVTWHGETRTVEGVGLDGTNVRLIIDEKHILINGVDQPLEVAPYIIDGHTLIPLRAFSTAFHAAINWEAATRTVTIQSPVRYIRMLAFYAIQSYQERDYVGHFSDTAYGWASLTPTGHVDLGQGDYKWPTPDGATTGEKLLVDAASVHTKRHLMIHAVDGPVGLTALIQDDARIATLAAEVTNVVDTKGFDGVVLDLEGLGLNEQGDALIRVQQGYTKLVAAVAKEMRARQKETIVSVHPLNGWYHGYDYPALAKEADLLQVMAHDYLQDGKPEPADQVEEAIRLAVKVVSPKQLLLGALVATETPETLVQKAGLAKRYGLAGISIWRLGQMGDAKLSALETSVQRTK